ncbi:acetyl-CoA carboxylase carboxyltransferase subunit alpha [Oscillospiraceae bacterium OttesenSCG-928-F05]|nr:acetyl-CoA carboxylase carboxyltransferase subunit alpha [Oscillospiraceae bacterium OttesenSCG-928-F05]
MSDKLTAFDRLTLAKHKDRPTIRQYLPLILDHFMELHGDRLYGDDPAVLAGIGSLQGRPVTVIGHIKGGKTADNIKQNFGMAHPEGYRKALRLMRQAEKFGRPVLCFVDTPGAYCGIQAEERGQGEAIARNLMEMMVLKVPVVSVVTGEGGSGGALGLAVANRVYMLENAVYSVISPKGCASILWKDALREKEAAEMMKITADDLLDLSVIDGIVPEPRGGAHKNLQLTAENIKYALVQALEALDGLDGATLASDRYDRFRAFGDFDE